MKKRLMVIYTVICLFLTLFSAQGKDEDFTANWDFGSYYVPAETVVHPMAKKFFRGLLNVSTGWGEIPRQIVLTSISDNLPKSLTVGVLKGMLMTMIRTGAGVYDTATFISAAPGYYDPLLDPPYVWERSFDMLSASY